MPLKLILGNMFGVVVKEIYKKTNNTPSTPSVPKMRLRRALIKLYFPSCELPLHISKGLGVWLRYW